MMGRDLCEVFNLDSANIFLEALFLDIRICKSNNIVLEISYFCKILHRYSKSLDFNFSCVALGLLHNFGHNKLCVEWQTN